MERLGWVLEGAATGVPAALASAFFVAFGLACTRLLGIRSWLLALATAIPTGVGALAIAAELVGILGVELPMTAIGLAGLAVAALAGALQSAVWPAPARHGQQDPGWIVWAGLVVGVLATLAVWSGGIGNFALPPQANDDIWHGYLVERLTHMPIITAHTVAPPLVTSAEPVLFYQYGVHLAWALTHSATGISVPEVMNGGWAVHTGLLLTAGSAALAWRLYPEQPLVAACSAMLSPAVVVLPYITNGLLPYSASLAMVPGFLALLVTHVSGKLEMRSTAPALAAIGIFLTHPTGAIVGAMLATPLAIQAIVEQGGRLLMWAAVRRLATVGLVALIGALPWLFAAGARGLGEAPASADVGGLLDAIVLTLVLGTPWTSVQPVLGALVLVGVVASVSARRGWGLAVGWLILAGLFVGTVTGSPSFLAITQPWHAHWYRVVAALGLTVPPLAGLGIVTLAQVARRLPIVNARRRMAFAVTAALVVVVAAGAAYGGAQGQSIVRSAWHAGNRVTATDVEMFAELDSLTEPGETVFNNPRDGSTWMYPMFEVLPVQPYIYGIPGWGFPLVNGKGFYRFEHIGCMRLLEEAPAYAVVKSVTGAIGLEEYDVAGYVARHPLLFSEVARTATAVIYAIDKIALVDCAGVIGDRPVTSVASSPTYRTCAMRARDDAREARECIPQR